MTYDQWKTTDPREYERDIEDDCPTELDLAYERIRELESALGNAIAAMDRMKKFLDSEGVLQ